MSCNSTSMKYAHRGEELGPFDHGWLTDWDAGVPHY